MPRWWWPMEPRLVWVQLALACVWHWMLQRFIVCHIVPKLRSECGQEGFRFDCLILLNDAVVCSNGSLCAPWSYQFVSYFQVLAWEWRGPKRPLADALARTASGCSVSCTFLRPDWSKQCEHTNQLFFCTRCFFHHKLPPHRPSVLFSEPHLTCGMCFMNIKTFHHVHQIYYVDWQPDHSMIHLQFPIHC